MLSAHYVSYPCTPSSPQHPTHLTFLMSSTQIISGRRCGLLKMTKNEIHIHAILPNSSIPSPDQRNWQVGNLLHSYPNWDVELAGHELQRQQLHE